MVEGHLALVRVQSSSAGAHQLRAVAVAAPFMLALTGVAISGTAAAAMTATAMQCYSKAMTLYWQAIHICTLHADRFVLCN